MIPISKPTLPDLSDLSDKFEEIFKSGQLTNGKYVEQFEEACAAQAGTKYAVAVSSCTSGLILLHKTLGLDGDVILPSFTFSATGHSLIWNNLTPVFVDCEEDSCNIDINRVEAMISPKTSAIFGVDIFGNPCDRRKLKEIANKHGLAFIIDSAHGLGSSYDKQKISYSTDALVFSLSPTKVVVAGEGGIVATNDEQLAAKLKKARNYGDPGNYNCEIAGLNARMTEINAVTGLASLRMVEDNVTRRNFLAQKYIEELSVLEGIAVQKIKNNSLSTYKDFTIVIDEDKTGISRNALQESLSGMGIQTKAYFDPPLHLQDAYRDFLDMNKENLKITEHLSANCLSLPIYSHMTDEDQSFVIDSVVRCLHK